MSGSDLALLIAAGFLVAFAAGIGAHWLALRVGRPPPEPPPPPADPTGEKLAAAEAGRDAAVRELEEVRTRFSRQVAERDAELRATMDGLGQARREAMELRRALEAERARRG